MIYYFSGTGNSKWVAKQIGKEISDKVVSISEMNKNGEMPNEVKEGEILGIVFPSHISLAPKPVMEFVKKIKVDKNAFVFVVSTCGDSSGYAVKVLQKHINIDSGYSVIMPNNHITMIGSESDEVIRNKIKNAKIKISSICEDIKNRKKELQYDEGIVSMLKSYVIAPIVLSKLNDKKFYVEDSCIGCKLCERACPVQNIEVAKGYPIWKNNCIHCMACIQHCPKKAIQYGKSTKNRKRFVMKDNFDI